jgi:hypothetical protein
MRSERESSGGAPEDLKHRRALRFLLNPLYLKLAFRQKFSSEIRSAVLCPSAHSNRTAAIGRRHMAF